MKDTIVMVLGSREGAGAPLGGIQKAVLGQISAFLANGIGVYLITASYPCAERARAMGVAVEYSPIWHNGVKPVLFPWLWMKLLKVRLNHKVRCVIHHSGRTWFWGYLFFVGIPQVQVLHREFVQPYRFFRRWLALSPQFAAFLQEQHALGGWRKITWAPNGLLSQPSPLLSGPQAQRNVFTIGFIGRAGEGKGIHVLFEAASKVLADGKSLNIRCAGDGDDFIRAAADRTGITDHIEFIGWLSDLHPFFDSIDLLVLPSLKESFGLVLIEAMAAGKPVLSTACNGPASIVLDEKTGYLVPVGDSRALAAKLRQAMENTELSAMGAAGYQRVMECYMPKAVGVQLKQALEELGATFESFSDANV